MANPSREASNAVHEGSTPLCKGYQQVSTAALAASTALTIPAGTTAIMVQAEVADVRWTADGITVPTASVGMLLYAGRDMWYPAGIDSLAALRFIRTAAGSIINVHYY